MTLVLAAHLIVAIAVLLAGRRLGRAVFLVGALAPLSALVWAIAVAGDVMGGSPVEISATWIESLGLTLDLRIDGFSLLMVFVVAAVGVLVFAYSARYFVPRTDLGGFAATLVAFAGAMLGIVTADNVLLLFVFWELTSVASFLLIGFDDRSATARAAALKALLVTAVGGMAMLAGFILLAQAAGSFLLTEILAAAPAGGPAAVGLVLVAVGAFAKSAQVPFHFWLPGAMAAPTPVSAYLHSATMVKAGIYLIARLAPVFAPLVTVWRPLVVGIGVATMILGGWRALAEKDMKLVLASGTVSQLGFMVALLGYGDPALTRAGVALLVAHAVFKAALFMVVGVVDRSTASRQISKLAGWGREMPVTWWVALVAAASMAGVPPMLGFLAKEAGISGLLELAGGAPLMALVLTGSALTAAYSLHLFTGSRQAVPEEGPVASAERPRPAILAAPVVLAAFTLAAGLFPGIVDGLVGAAAESLLGRAGDVHLALWHGFQPALAWSAAVLAGGYLLWRAPLSGLRAITSQVPEATSVYNASLRYLNRLADRVTSVVQNGSLPVYLQVILATAVVLPGFGLVRHWQPDLTGPLVDSPLRLVVALAVVLSAAGVALARRRMGAVLFLGAIGYGVAVLFVLHGAPDLALTQLLVETLSLAMFVMVLRHLPDRWEVVRWRASQTGRIVISVAVALLMGGFALWASSSRVAPAISDEYIARAQPEGGGGNVVNVILTDFRGFDTLGEITVISLAAVGCVVLLGRARRRPTPVDEQE